jgi:hypothetical protein
MWGTVFTWLMLVKVHSSESIGLYQTINYQILNMNTNFYILINKAGDVRIT